VEVRGVLIVKCCSLKTASVTRLKRIIICILFIIIIENVNAIVPSKNLVSLSISIGMKSALSFEIGYEFTVTDFFAPEIGISIGIISRNISLEVNMNCYIGYLHLSTPFNFGFSRPEHEWLPYINWTPGIGIAIDAPASSSKYGLVYADIGWTFPLIFDTGSFLSKPGIDFQWGGKLELF